MRNPAKSSKRVHGLRRWVEENSFVRACDRDLVFDASDLTRRHPDPTSSPLCSSCSPSSRVPQQPANPRASLVCSPLAGHGTPRSFVLIGPLAPRPHARPHAAYLLARRTVSLSSRTGPIYKHAADSEAALFIRFIFTGGADTAVRVFKTAHGADEEPQVLDGHNEDITFLDCSVRLPLLSIAFLKEPSEL